MKNPFEMMKQVQELQGRMARMQEELAALEVSGQSGAGLVTITLNGKGEMRSVKIDPSLLKPEEAEIVEDLVLAAFTDAKSKVEGEMQKRMQALTGGLPLPPGMKLF